MEEVLMRDYVDKLLRNKGEWVEVDDPADGVFKSYSLNYRLVSLLTQRLHYEFNVTPGKFPSTPDRPNELWSENKFENDSFYMRVNKKEEGEA